MYWLYLSVLLPVSVVTRRAIPHVQECLNELHFVIPKLDAGKLRMSLAVLAKLTFSISNMFWATVPVTKLSFDTSLSDRTLYYSEVD